MSEARPGAAPVLLFFKPWEVDRFLPGDRHLKRLVRPLYDRLHRRQKINGVGMSFRLLARGLETAGYAVRCNDYAYAKAHPDHPVGLVGSLALIDGWRLPNPALLGPSLYDAPGQAPRLFDDPRYRAYVTLGDWMGRMFDQVYEGRCTPWFAGIDAEAWPDLSDYPKDLDFLVYDKVMWERPRREADLVGPVLGELEHRGLSFERVRYGDYDHDVYRALLARSRALLFLCDHETQGIAYQEAMASGLPVLAWDAGVWSDPKWKDHYEAPPPASSVPFFSADCGERFADAAGFGEQLDIFLERRDAYRPRGYVTQNLGLRRSGELYADAYFGIARRAES